MPSSATSRTLLALMLSGALHGLLWWTSAGLRMAPPELDIDLEFVADVTFGDTSPPTLSTNTPTTPPSSAEPLAPSPEEPKDEDPTAPTSPTSPDAGLDTVPDASSPDGAADAGTPDAGNRDAGTPDASPPDASSPDGAADTGTPDAGNRDAGTPDASPPDAGPEATPERRDGPTPPVAHPPGTRLPPGARFALRVNLRALRGSPLEGGVRRLLGAIPEWRQALRGSGIEPMRDLDHVLIAHPGAILPNGWPDPSRFAIAGAYRSHDGDVAAIARRMATARGRTALRKRFAGRTAWRWWDDSGYPRWVVPLGGGHFLLATSRDLPALLAIAASPHRPAGRATSSLEAFARWVAPPEGALLSIEAVGLRRFARRGGRWLPNTLNAWVLPAGEAWLARAAADYPTAEEGAEALAFWERARDAYARNVFVQILGFAPLLQRMHLEREAARLTARLTLTPREAQRLLRQIAAFLPRGNRSSHPAPPRPPPGEKEPSPKKAPFPSHRVGAPEPGVPTQRERPGP